MQESALEMKKQIEEMSRVLLDHDHEMQKAISELDICQSFRGPIRHLPTEILCRIFRLCIPDHDFKRPKNITAPLLFGRVCKHWRETAWNEPSLWTRPRVYVSPSPRLFASTMRNTIDHYATLSKSRPIALCVTQTFEGQRYAANQPVTPHHWKEDFRILRSTLTLCRTLSLSTDSHIWMTAFSSALDPSIFDALDTLVLKFRYPLPNHGGISLFSTTPNLRRLHIAVSQPTCLEQLSFPYSQLTELSSTFLCLLGHPIRGASGTVKKWKELVVKCGNLRNIDVYFHGRGKTDRTRGLDAPYLNVEPTTLPEAESLTLKTGFRADMASILSGFSFPSLRYLQLVSVANPMTIASRDIPFPEVLNSRISFVSGLTMLRLLRVEFTDEELHSLLQATPLLTSLDIMAGGYCAGLLFDVLDDEVVEILSISSDEIESPLLPRLRDLRLYFCEPETLSEAENVDRYAYLAKSRHAWANSHLDTRDQHVPVSMVSETVPSYPFRLYMRFDCVDYQKHWKTAIGAAIGPDSAFFFWPEDSTRNGWTKEL